MITHKKVIKQNGSGKTKRKIKSAAAFCACGVIFLLALTGCGGANNSGTDEPA